MQHSTVTVLKLSKAWAFRDTVLSLVVQPAGLIEQKNNFKPLGSAPETKMIVAQ